MLGTQIEGSRQLTRDDLMWFCSVIGALHDEGTLPRPTAKGRAKDLYAPVLVYRHPINRRRWRQPFRPYRLHECEALYGAALRAGWLCIRDAIDAYRNKRPAVFVNDLKTRSICA